MSTVDLKSAVTNKELSQYLSRRDKFYYRYMMYNDDYYYQIYSRLLEMFSPTVSLKLHKQIDMTNNIYKTIVNQISRVYSFGVNREVEDENTLNLIRNGSIQKAMKQANRYVNAFNDVLLQVGFNEKTNQPKFIFRLPHKTEVKTDGDDNLIEVEYFIEKLEGNSEKWAYWSDSEHYYKIYDPSKQEFKIEYAEGNEEGINPFKELPFLVMQKGFRDGDFWDVTTGDDLIEITRDNAVYSTFSNYMKKMQSFKQIYIVGKEISGITGQLLDPSSAITVNAEDATLGVLDLQSDLKGLAEAIEQNAIKVASNYNISPSSFKLSGIPSSGFALKMENTKLDEETIEMQMDFLGYEKELFRLIAIVSDNYNVKYSDNVNITINEPSYQESRADTLSNYEKSINLGIKSPIEIIQSEKEINEDEAIKLYNENIKYRNEANNRLNSNALNLQTTQTALEEANR